MFAIQRKTRKKSGWGQGGRRRLIVCLLGPGGGIHITENTAASGKGKNKKGVSKK